MTLSDDRARARLLHREVRWLVSLRWVAGSAIAAGGAAMGIWLPDTGLHPGVPALLGLLVLAYNAVFLGALRRAPRLAARHAPLVVHASLQILLDVLCLVVLTIWTGGVTSPLLGAFFFHMFFARLLLPRPHAYAAALVAVAFMAIGLRAAGAWPSEISGAATAAGWAVALVVTVFLTDRIAGVLQRLDAARAQRARKLREVAAILRAQQESLLHSERLATLGQLAAGVAHEINNPLSNIDGLLQLLQRRPDQPPPPESLRKLREQVERIQRIVRQLGAYSRRDGGKAQLVPVNDLVRSAVGLIDLDQRARRAHVELDLPDRVGLVRTNPHALTQILVNLLANALDATADVPAPRIAVRTDRPDGRLRIRVEDNGQGIPPEHLKRVFEPFFTTKPAGHGTGLGLSISDKLVRDMGGSIAAATLPRGGAVFTVQIPDLPAPPIAGRPPMDAKE
ncbi:MAG: GHKL domain-containing protein [Phycisphaerae bacterium]|nr:GHKL domain-containing protein [Phycisphaerae bacterium]